MVKGTVQKKYENAEINCEITEIVQTAEGDY
jgi:hypothetical protein